MVHYNTLLLQKDLYVATVYLVSSRIFNYYNKIPNIKAETWKQDIGATES